MHARGRLVCLASHMYGSGTGIGRVAGWLVMTAFLQYTEAGPAGLERQPAAGQATSSMAESRIHVLPGWVGGTYVLPIHAYAHSVL